MSDAFIVKRGGGRPYGVINATYPAGSICTCKMYSDQARTVLLRNLTASDTSGQFSFLISRDCYITVTATDGTNTKSVNTLLNVRNSYKEVTLVYELDLIVDGVVQTAFTAHSATATYNSANNTLDVKPDGSYYGGQEAYHSVLVDLTSYSSLKIKCRNSGSTTSVHARIIGGATYDATTISQNISTTMTTLTVNVSALTGNKYISINASSYLYNQDTGEKYIAVASIEDMWLE